MSLFTVTTLADSGTGSLRQAILDANATRSDDAIIFQDGLTGTITLTSGELAITDDLVITGLGAAELTISGDNTYRVFSLDNDCDLLNVSISGITITGGNTVGTGGAIFTNDENLTLDKVVITGNHATNDGGGIGSYGNDFILTLRNSTITGNSAAGYGGGIYLDRGGLVIENSTISNNSADYDGGGLYLYNPEAGNVIIRNSTITGNTAGDDGGGIYINDTQYIDVLIEHSLITGNTANNDGGGIYINDTDGANNQITINNSTISGNTALDGAGIYFDDPDSMVVVSNSTISGNTANSDGGGIYLNYTEGGSVTVENSTISGNTATGKGGGIYSYKPENPITIRNSTITANSAGSDGGGIYLYNNADQVTIESTIVYGNSANSSDNDIYNKDDSAVTILNSLLGTTVGSSNQTNPIVGNPLLGSLLDNGGFTQTHALGAGSPGIDAGSNPGSLTTDQRTTGEGNGFGRVSGSGIDIGAFEYSPITAIVDAVEPGPNGGAIDGSFTITLNQPAPNGGLPVSFTLEGTATLDTDYTLWINGAEGAKETIPVTGNSFTIKEALDTATLIVKASPDNTYDDNETVTLTLTGDSTYIAGPSSASLTIADPGPTDISINTDNIKENSPADSPVGILSTEDPTQGDSFTYSLVGGEKASFSIDGNKLFIKIESGNCEAGDIYDIRIQTTDSTGLTYQESLTINLSDVDEFYATITSPSAVTFAENDTGIVYTPEGTDPDCDPIVYSLAGTDADDFTLDKCTGLITFNNTPNAENPTDADHNNVYIINVIANAGGFSDTQTVTITVTDVNEFTPSITSSGTATFAENGTGVAYTVTATDADFGETLTYSISGTDASNFSINSTTGAVTFKSAPNYEAPSDNGSNNVYDITVTASDGTLSDSKSVAITVTDVNETTSNKLGTPGKDNLTGTSSSEAMYGYGDNDTLYGLGGNDSLYGDWGNDTLDGGNDNDYLDGGWNNDILIGGNGNDYLDGNWGNDTLIGGAGADTLKGGWDKDTFRFDSPSEKLDTISDMKPAEGDIIGIAASGFSGVSKGVLPTTAFRSGAGITTANSTAQRFIYNTSTGALYFDSDGSGGGSSFQIATLTGKPALSAGNIWIL